MMRTLSALAILAVVAGAASADAKTYFAETEKDFGVTAVGPALVHYFPITNTSKNSVQMGTPVIQCGCVSAALLKGTIAPGETTYLVATMNTSKIPTHQIGATKSVTVRVPFLSPTLEEVTLKVTTLARQDMLWSTTDGVVFGTVAKGKKATASMKVTLYGNEKWEISEIKAAGLYIKGEAKVASRSGGQTTYEIIGDLDEKCPIGSWMSEITIKTNASGIEKMRIPVTVNIVEPIISSPGNLKLGSLPMGLDQSLDVTLTGLQPFKVLDIKGGDATISAKAQTEGARHQHTLKISVKADKVGDLSRELKVETDSKDMPTVVLPVSATVKK